MGDLVGKATGIIALLVYSYALIAVFAMVLSSFDPGTATIPWWKRLGLSLAWLPLIIRRIWETRGDK